MIMFFFVARFSIDKNLWFTPKIELILDRLDAAVDPKDMNFPGSNFHSLKGDRKNFYSVHVNGNWVIIFKFENGEAYDVDLLDYH